MNDIDKDIELCKHILIMISEGRLKGFHKVTMINNLLSSRYAKNFVQAMGDEFIAQEQCISIKNILEVINADIIEESVGGIKA